MNAQIREEAAEWLVELRVGEVDADMRDRFAAWLRTSPEHVRMYLELVAFWDDAGAYDKSRSLEVESLIALARAESNVVALESVAGIDPDPVKAAVPSAQNRASRFKLTAVAAVVLIAVTTTAWFALSNGTSYQTGIGQQLSVGLADGSSVELNARSRIRVRYSDHERIVELIAGQALFRVAKDTKRPFVVVSADTHVRAVGTQFDVHRKRVATVVTVLEGRVALLQPTASTLLAAASPPASPPVEIGAGEQAIVTARAKPQPHRANIETATAWTQQQIVFESAPLPDVAEEFNRFNQRRLVVAGEALANFRVSGNFPALDPTSLPRFLRFLRAQPGIEISESDDRIVVTQK